MVEASVDDIAVAGEGNQFLALLKTGAGAILPIVIDAFQAISISTGRSGEDPGRPLPHDLMLSMLELFSAKLSRIEITDLIEGVYFAMLVIERQGVQFEVDARPSDALALAVRVQAPIFIAEHVIEENALTDDYGGGGFQA
ncbi:MAG: bifunctional nuclease family protein [Truepera sp.]|nr:bifunctional nuclease family protein [Truepera sp.]